MSTPTTARGALLRRAGILLVAAALLGAPATSAIAGPTASPTASPTTGPTADGAPTASASASQTPSATATADPTPTSDPSPTSSTTPGSQTGSTDPAPLPSITTPSPPAGLVTGERTTVFGPRAATGPLTSSEPALVAARYLEQQLVAGGHHFSVTYDGVDYADHGVTADAVLALDAAGTGQAEAAKATAWLAGEVVGYIGFGDPSEISAGSVAKLLNVAIAQGIDPTAFGNYDLLATLTALEQPNGRFSDVSKYGDSSNTFGQSFALIGLHRAGGAVSADARGYLLAQQCANGGFKLYMNDAGCTADTDADPDATAMAVQALIAVGGSSIAVSDGLDYLANRQGPSGGVGGGGPTSGVNANSTGLAGQAFLAGGRTAQARAAVGYLTTLQYGCGLPAALRGGIAYDAAAFKVTTAAGAKATPADQDRRSTSQAMLALAGAPLATVTADGSDAVAPSPDCPATTEPSSTPSSSPSSTVDPTSSGGATEGAGGSDPSSTVAADATGSLAQTGTDPMLPVLLGLLLVVVGALAVWAGSRRRGAHA